MKRLIGLVLLGTVFLTGCSASSYISEVVPETIEEQLITRIISEAGVLEDESYAQYEELASSGHLNENGEYDGLDGLEMEPEENNASEGTVKVSFGENRFFVAEYYLDESKSIPVDREAPKLNPGDSIYAAVTVDNPNSNNFDLQEFRILVDNQQTVVSADDFKQNGGLLYQIPDDYQGEKILIFPVGVYTERSLMFSVYSVDDMGKQTQMQNVGKWLINGKDAGANPTVGATESYKVRYNLESDRFFYVSAYPSPFTDDPNLSGYVEFYEMLPTESADLISVEIHPFLSISINFEKKGTVAINDGVPVEVGKGKTWSESHLKYGDTLLIEADGEITITDGDYTHVRAEKTSLGGGKTRYKLYIQKDHENNLAQDLIKVVNVIRNIEVTLSGKSKYGVCTYTVDGKKVSSGRRTLKENQKIVLEYTITDPDVHFSSGVSSWLNQNLPGHVSETKKFTVMVTANLNSQTINPDDYFEFTTQEG